MDILSIVVTDDFHHYFLKYCLSYDYHHSFLSIAMTTLVISRFWWGLVLETFEGKCRFRTSGLQGLAVLGFQGLGLRVWGFRVRGLGFWGV